MYDGDEPSPPAYGELERTLLLPSERERPGMEIPPMGGVVSRKGEGGPCTTFGTPKEGCRWMPMGAEEEYRREREYDW